MFKENKRGGIILGLKVWKLEFLKSKWMELEHPGEDCCQAEAMPISGSSTHSTRGSSNVYWIDQ